MKRQALVLAAHGSHKNARSGEPARRHAAALRQSGRFSQVVAAFWKEFPSLRDVPYLLDADEVFVVPLFMADGYFTARVVPRELELDGPLTSRDGVTWHYTPPVGSDPRMAEVISRRALAATTGVPADELALVVVGHGTVQNRQSKQTVLAQVERLRAGGPFAEVAAAYMEEPPLVSDIPSLVSAPNVVVVPLFVADGFHTDEDIPRDLGLDRTPTGSWQLPGLVGGRRLWYTSSVGTSPDLVEVILARVAQAGGAVASGPPATTRPPWAEAFVTWLRETAPTTWLEVRVSRQDDGWLLHHAADPGGLPVGLDDLRRLARGDASGTYRPLPTAPTLPSGWLLGPLGDEQLIAALEILYPATIAAWQAERAGRLRPVSWQQVARRQTGQHGLLKRLETTDLRAAAAVRCRDGCLRRVVWDLAADEPLGLERGEGPVPCYEPCSVLQALAREVVGWRRGEEVAIDGPLWQHLLPLLAPEP